MAVASRGGGERAEGDEEREGSPGFWLLTRSGPR
jgi:hypothetical protein